MSRETQENELSYIYIRIKCGLSIMIPDLRSPLSVWATNRLAEYRPAFTRDEAIRGAGVSHGAFLDAAERLQRRQSLYSPRRGFYVVVPPQFLVWEAPPPEWYIDDLMRFEGCSYYVGLLTAAKRYGASHQAIMEFQVIADKQLPRIRSGRTILAFRYRKDIACVEDGVNIRVREMGRVRVSSPELTILDLVRYPRAVLGIDYIATVLEDLRMNRDLELDSYKLAHLSQAFERSVVQRLGYMLDRFGHASKTGPLKEALDRSKIGWVELDPIATRKPIFTPEVVEHNKKWHVVVRRVPEPD